MRSPPFLRGDAYIEDAQKICLRTIIGCEWPDSMVTEPNCDNFCGHHRSLQQHRFQSSTLITRGGLRNILIVRHISKKGGASQRGLGGRAKQLLEKVPEEHTCSALFRAACAAVVIFKRSAGQCNFTAVIVSVILEDKNPTWISTTLILLSGF